MSNEGVTRMTSREKTYWNGEKTNCVRGTGVVVDYEGSPPYAWWSNLVGQRVPVVRVEYFDEPMYLYNEGNHGWLKVTEGKGSPRIGHANLMVEKFIPDEVG